MNVSRRYLYSLVGAAGCCLPAVLCESSLGQAQTTQPNAPNAQSTNNPDARNDNTGRQPQNTAAGAQQNAAQSGANQTGANQNRANQTGANQSGTPQASPPNSNPVTDPSGAVGPTARRNAAVETGNPGAASGDYDQTINDADLAAWLIVDNQGEINVSEIGRQKAQDPNVKQFADRMIHDHGQLLEKLRPIASNVNPIPGGRRTDSVSAGGANPAGATNPNAGTAVSQAGAVPGPGGQAAAQSLSTGRPSVMSLKQEVAAQCLQSKQQELNSKQGAEFDKCFMGMQVAMHMEAVATLEVFQKHASGRMRQTIDEALQTTKSHLEQAKQLVKEVDQRAGNGSKQ